MVRGRTSLLHHLMEDLPCLTAGYEALPASQHPSHFLVLLFLDPAARVIAQRLFSTYHEGEHDLW